MAYRKIQTTGPLAAHTRCGPISRGKILHTRNQHLRNHWIFVAFPKGCSVHFPLAQWHCLKDSQWISTSIFSCVFQGICNQYFAPNLGNPRPSASHAAADPVGTGLTGTRLNGYPALKGSMQLRTASKNSSPTTPGKNNRIGTRWSKYPFSRCQSGRVSSARLFSYLRFRRFRSRIWTNLKSGGPQTY